MKRKEMNKKKQTYHDKTYNGTRKKNFNCLVVYQVIEETYDIDIIALIEIERIMDG